MLEIGRELQEKLSGAGMLALDIDGTILTNDKRLTRRTASAIEQAVCEGLHVVLVTGRPLSGIPDNVLSIPGIRYVITSNGAVTEDIVSGQILRSAYIRPETAKEIVKIPMERQLVHGVFKNGIGYCEPEFYELQISFFAGTPLEDYVRRSRRPVDDVNALIDDPSAGVENIWLIAGSRDERNEINDIISAGWDVRTVLTASRDVEVGDPRADKGMAASGLAETLGVKKNGIIAIGDNANDIGLLAAAGVPVAMGNSKDALKKEAVFVTDSNEEDGAAAFIEEMLTIIRGGRS